MTLLAPGGHSSRAGQAAVGSAAVLPPQLSEITWVLQGLCRRSLPKQCLGKETRILENPKAWGEQLLGKGCRRKQQWGVKVWFEWEQRGLCAPWGMKSWVTGGDPWLFPVFEACGITGCALFLPSSCKFCAPVNSSALTLVRSQLNHAATGLLNQIPASPVHC